MHRGSLHRQRSASQVFGGEFVFGVARGADKEVRSLPTGMDSTAVHSRGAGTRCRSAQVMRSPEAFAERAGSGAQKQGNQGQNEYASVFP